jgi:hypothetical protein
VQPPDAAAEAYRRVYVATHRPRLHWPFLPWFLLLVGVLLLAVAAVVDVTEDRVPDGFVRTTGRVVEVRERECGLGERSCDPLQYQVEWIDTEGRVRDASFGVGVGQPEVGDPFDLRYRPEGAPRAQEMGEGYYAIRRLRILAAVCLVAAAIAGTVNLVRRRRWAARRARVPSGGTGAAPAGGA